MLSRLLATNPNISHQWRQCYLGNDERREGEGAQLTPPNNIMRTHNRNTTRHPHIPNHQPLVGGLALQDQTRGRIQPQSLCDDGVEEREGGQICIADAGAPVRSRSRGGRGEGGEFIAKEGDEVGVAEEGVEEGCEC